MKCFVTGATGFLGANLVQELLARGHQVKALTRARSDLRGLAGADCEKVVGDVNDQEKLTALMRGCDWVFHVAACYQLWMPDYAEMYDVNVTGTRKVIAAAAAAGVARIVHTSTVGTIALPQAVLHGRVLPSDERMTVTEAQMTNDYKRSKWLAERIALRAARDGLPVVVVNPSAPIGPRDVKPTPTGQTLVDYMNRRMPAYVETGLNWVHVRDVAIGHVLAAEKGRVGERYILGHAEGNWTLRETFSVLQQLTGVPAPTRQIPHWVALLAAHVGERLARFTGRPPRAPLAGVRMARYMMFFNPAKAVRELGLPQTPPDQAFLDAIEWFRAHGYLKR